MTTIELRTNKAVRTGETVRVSLKLAKDGAATLVFDAPEIVDVLKEEDYLYSRLCFLIEQHRLNINFDEFGEESDLLISEIESNQKWVSSHDQKFTSYCLKATTVEILRWVLLNRFNPPTA